MKGYWQKGLYLFLLAAGFVSLIADKEHAALLFFCLSGIHNIECCVERILERVCHP